MEDTTTGLGPPPWSDNPCQGPAHAPTSHRLTPPQTLWLAYQLAEQRCRDRWRHLEGEPPPPRRSTDPDPDPDPDPGEGAWKPDKIPHLAALRLHAGLPKAHQCPGINTHRQDQPCCLFSSAAGFLPLSLRCAYAGGGGSGRQLKHVLPPSASKFAGERRRGALTAEP